MSPHSDSLSWSEQTSRCSFSLMLCAYWRNYKYQFDSLWFDPIGVEPAIFHTRGDHANNRGFNSIYTNIFKTTKGQQLLDWLPHETLYCRWSIDSECDALQRPTCFSLSRFKWRVWHSPYSRHSIASRPKGSWCVCTPSPCWKVVPQDWITVSYFCSPEFSPERTINCLLYVHLKKSFFVLTVQEKNYYYLFLGWFKKNYKYDLCLSWIYYFLIKV